MSITLTKEQQQAVDAISRFASEESSDVFVLRGSAGTGKTTIIAEIARALYARRKSCIALAPTGRAARILGEKLDRALGTAAPDAGTIHRSIYDMRELTVNEEATDPNDPGMRFIFSLKTDEPTASVIIVDEASMVGDVAAKGDFIQFGSGRLLSDLIRFARVKREGRTDERVSKILFVGDPAQLPPVSDPNSPALDEKYLRESLGLSVETFELRQVLRQAAHSAILNAATRLRDSLRERVYTTFNIPPMIGEIEERTDTEAVTEISDALSRSASSVAIVFSNAAALEYNRSVRERLWGDESRAPRAGDVLLVNRNSSLYPLNNGDLVRVHSTDETFEEHQVPIRGHGLVTLRFRTAKVISPAGVMIECRVMENLLDSPSRELSALEQRALLVFFEKRHPHLKPKSSEFRLAIRTDSYMNALQVKFGYAMTCHKAQGGEWETAIVDFRATTAGANENFFRWAYTAITRAQRRVLLVSPPSFSPISTLGWNGHTDLYRPQQAAAPFKPTVSPKERAATTESVASGPSEPVTAPTVQQVVPPMNHEPPPTSQSSTTGGPSPLPAQTGHGSMQETDTPQGDPDWTRFGFQQGTEPLFEFHCRLRAAWGALGITIDEVEHLQYKERYRLSRPPDQTSVEYNYKKGFRPTSVTAGPGVTTSPQLQRAATDAAHALMGGASALAPDTASELLLGAIDAALAASLIRRQSVQAFPYRLRVELTDGVRTGCIDFTYNGKGQWTGAAEVGGVGKTAGLFDEVQQLMRSKEEK